MGRQSNAILLACGAALLMLGWHELAIRFHYGGNQTGLFCIGDKQHLPPALEESTYRIHGSYGYDGQFYRLAAHDPTLGKGFDAYMDNAQRRYGRILVPAVAWVLAAGRETWIDRTYQFTVVLFCALGVYWCSRYLAEAGRSPVWGLLFLLLPATLASLDRMLLDGPLCALFAGFLWYTRMGHHKRLHLVLLLAPLIRETGLLLAAGTSGAQILRKQWRAAIINAAAAVPALCWWVYVRARTSDAPVAPELGRPIIGLIERLFNLQPERYSAKPSLQGIAAVLDLAAIAGFIACLALGMSALWLYRAEWRNPVLLTVSGFVALGLALGQETQLADAYAYSRPLSPLLLWIMLQSVAAGRWTALVPPLLVSAGVGVYLLPPAWSFAKGLLSL